MVSSEQIRRELQEIRYYYARRDALEDASHSIGPMPVKRILEKYNCAIREAPLRLYDLYVCLYVRNETQEAVADEWGYTPQYVRKLIGRLFSYFKEKLTETEEQNGKVSETLSAQDAQACGGGGGRRG